MEDQSIGLDISEILQQLSVRMGNEQQLKSEINELGDLINNSGLHSLMQLQEVLKQKASVKCQSSANASSLISDMQQLSQRFSDNDILSALSAMFHSSPHLGALMSCYDKISNGTFDEPQLSDILNDSFLNNDDSEETMKVVRLVKGEEPLGATIATDDLTGDIIIARIMKGGAADRSGLIHVNDILVEVNDVLAKGKTPADLIKLLAGFKGPLTFKLIPGESPKEVDEESAYLRSHFTYLPQADSLIPCIEAGIAFYPGDILHVVSKEDSSWWQAMKVESLDKAKLNGAKVGLIPSLRLQSRREKLKRQAQSKSITSSIKGSNVSLISSGRRNTWNMIRSSFRRKRNARIPAAKKLEITNQTPYYPPYELVAKYNPTQATSGDSGVRTYRPMILVGPQGVGRNELKDRLIDSNPSHYGVPVPHTSRPQQPGEVDKKDYHFVTREYMEVGIRQERFLEYGEYKGNYYGTSLDAVHAVIESGLVCVLTPYPQALTLLRTKEFMSYIIFIKPPSVVEMGKLNDDFVAHGDGKGKLTIERPGNLPFTDEEMRSLVSRGERMQSMYGRLFDTTIVNNDSDIAFSKLKEISFFLENDEQWVPADWVDTIQ